MSAEAIIAPQDRDRAVASLRRATGSLCTTAVGRMETEMAWFRELSAEERSWVGVIVQAGVRGFVDWYAHEGDRDERGLAAAVFGSAPRALTSLINLRQTVDLIRLSVEVVESNVDRIVDPADAPAVHQAILRYAREVAFATAEVHARAAEVRGAWDARLEALVVDAVVRADTDETLLSRASALGWSARGEVAVVLGMMPTQRPETDSFDEVRRTARAAGMDALCAAQGDRLVVVLGGVTDPARDAAPLASLFADGPVVAGPATPDLSQAHRSARAALSAHRAAPGWPQAPRPVSSAELIAERALAGDGHARRYLVEQVYLPLAAARGELIETLSAYFAAGSSIEGAARTLFCHANTVRYRLKQVGDLTGTSPTHAREAFLLQIALVLGRQSGRDLGHHE